MMIFVTALMENSLSSQKALLNEHGLSYYFESEDFRLLFDCGSGAHTLFNAHKLGRNILGADAVVLSHSHYDHAGGYRDYVESGNGAGILYTGQNFFEPKFSVNGEKYTDLSCGFDESFLREHRILHREVCDVLEIFPSVFLLTAFPRPYSFETIPERFVKLQKNRLVPDDFSDEVCLVLNRDDALTVFCGCSHPGILNMLTHVQNTFKKPIRAVYGGTHLAEADENRIFKTAEILNRMNIRTLGFSHCTGASAEATLAANFRGKCCHLGVGDCVFID